MDNVIVYQPTTDNGPLAAAYPVFYNTRKKYRTFYRFNRTATLGPLKPCNTLIGNEPGLNFVKCSTYNAYAGHGKVKSFFPAG